MLKNLYLFLKRKSQIHRNDIVGKILVLLTGFAATVWFLSRVIPKPSRATYPCMQAAAPLMSSFVVYLISLFGGIKFVTCTYNLIKDNKFAFKIVALFSFVVIGIFLGSSKYLYNADSGNVKQLMPANSPVGIAQGIYPGRVVWTHAPGTASWDESDNYWFLDKYNSQSGCDWLVENSIINLTGCTDIKDAWNSLFVYFNEKRGNKSGYTKGEHLVIKINQNNTYSHQDSKEINASPHLLLSLLKSLINDAGVPEEYITVTDPSRFVTDFVFNKCSGVFPNVRFVDNIGGDGRIKSEYVGGIMHYSQDNGKLANGISKDFVEADYVINMAILKGHVGQGVTLCGKNWYGAMSIHSDWRNNHHNGFNQNQQGKPQYITFVDFMGHNHLGGKTFLWLIDGLYGSKAVNGVPKPKWTLSPFNCEWPCSLFASQDPVAIDMVGNDFLISQFPDMPDVNYSDMYMIEAAMANNPPSGTKYMPNGDGVVLSSLGVAEHWNNSKYKQYGRNLGKDYGIELLYLKK